MTLSTRSLIKVLLASTFAVTLYAGDAAAPTWTPEGAAKYLDGRAAWWINWPAAARDHGTFCVSCHTAVPYALGRPALRQALKEQGPSENEKTILENVAKRVHMWADVEPFYKTQKPEDPKSIEARGTESVLNALILVNADAPKGQLSDDAKLALSNMWALQVKDGEKKGAWSWLRFHNQPWEDVDDSQFYGATLVAVTVGMTPQAYQSSPEVKAQVKLLSEFLMREAPSQSPLNRAMLLWVSAKVPGIATKATQQAIVSELSAKQLEDGGWSSALLIGEWKRHDGTPLDTKSDGYATGLVTLAMEEAGVPRTEKELERGLAWLRRNQDASDGFWPAESLNKQRKPSSDAGPFMRDAATAYAVLALEHK